MGVFEKQVRERMEADQQLLEDSFAQLAEVVLDRWSLHKLDDEQMIAQDVIDDILRYYHERPAQIPEGITDPALQLEYVFRPSGLQIREVSLQEGWHHDAYGAMLAFLADSERAVALIPRLFSGYWYKDPHTGKKTRVTKRTARQFSEDALCFYYPLPRKSLGIRDLLLFMNRSIDRGDVLAIAFATLASVLCGMVEPAVYNVLVSKIMRLGQLHLFVGVGSFLLTASFASIMLGLIKNLLVARINIKASLAMEASVMMRVLSMPMSFFRQRSSGDLVSRVSSMPSLCSILVQNVFSLGLGGLMSLLYVVQIFRFAPALWLPAILIVFTTLAVSIVSSAIQVRLSRQKMELQARERGLGYAMLGGIQKIRLAGAEKRVFARWANLWAKQAKLEYHGPLFLRLNAVITQAISLAGTIALYSVALASGVSVPHYYAFSAAFGRMSAAFAALAGIATSAAEIQPLLEMVEPILKAEPEESANKPVASTLTGRIEVIGVSFRYGEEQPYVFRDLSLTIRAGEYVAIVGKTGCGKSTLVRLLLGFEQPEKGSVYYDNYDLSHTDPASVRRRIGTVMQDGQLLAGDIYSNISLSAPLLTEEEAWEAAEMAMIADDIRAMPMGMNTVISEGSGSISGGQKQRLLIARAVAPKPRILIFDEATSALDNITQKKISEALDAMKCTRLVIAHRLSTIRQCDRILFLKDGAIVEEGTYDELIRKDGEFAELVARQRLE